MFRNIKFVNLSKLQIWTVLNATGSLILPVHASACFDFTEFKFTQLLNNLILLIKLNR